MITITLPEWLLYLLTVALVANIIKDLLEMYLNHLKRGAHHEADD